MDDDLQESTLLAPFEVKFSLDGALGEFTGYASTFDVQDSHGDVVRRGAFERSLAERKAAGRPLPMHVMHRFMGGDGVPVGVWKSVEEDAKGLKVHGKISGMNTDGGRLLYERVKDGALGGLSIGYRLQENGATYGKKPGEPKRILTGVHLKEISLVDDPSNPLTRVDAVKRVEPIKSIEDVEHLERILREAGVAGRAAEKIAAAGFAALTKPAAPEIDIDRVKAVLAQHERERNAPPKSRYFRNN